MTKTTAGPFRTDPAQTRRAAMDFLRTRVMPMLVDLQEAFTETSPDETFLACLSAAGHELDPLSLQHPAIRTTLDALNKAGLAVAEKIWNTKNVATLQREIPLRLKRLTPRIDAVLQAHGLESYEAAAGLLHAILALGMERQSEFPFLTEMLQREIIPLSTELIARIGSTENPVD